MMTFAQQIADARRAISRWSKRKRESVVLEGGAPSPRNYVQVLPHSEKHDDRACPHRGLCDTYGCDGDCDAAMAKEPTK